MAHYMYMLNSNEGIEKYHNEECDCRCYIETNENSKEEYNKMFEMLQENDVLTVNKLESLGKHDVETLMRRICELYKKGVCLRVVYGKLVIKPEDAHLKKLMNTLCEYDESAREYKTQLNKGKLSKGGRHYMSLPEFDSYYNRVQSGEITAKYAMQKLKVSKSTYYRRVRLREKKGDV